MLIKHVRAPSPVQKPGYIIYVSVCITHVLCGGAGRGRAGGEGVGGGGGHFVSAAWISCNASQRLYGRTSEPLPEGEITAFSNIKKMALTGLAMLAHHLAERVAAVIPMIRCASYHMHTCHFTTSSEHLNPTPLTRSAFFFLQVLSECTLSNPGVLAW